MYLTVLTLCICRFPHLGILPKTLKKEKDSLYTTVVSILSISCLL